MKLYALFETKIIDTVFYNIFFKGRVHFKFNEQINTKLKVLHIFLLISVSLEIKPLNLLLVLS